MFWPGVLSTGRWSTCTRIAQQATPSALLARLGGSAQRLARATTWPSGPTAKPPLTPGALPYPARWRRYFWRFASRCLELPETGDAPARRAACAHLHASGTPAALTRWHFGTMLACQPSPLQPFKSTDKYTTPRRSRCIAARGSTNTNRTRDAMRTGLSINWRNFRFGTNAVASQAIYHQQLLAYLNRTI